MALDASTLTLWELTSSLVAVTPTLALLALGSLSVALRLRPPQLLVKAASLRGHWDLLYHLLLLTPSVAVTTIATGVVLESGLIAAMSYQGLILVYASSISLYRLLTRSTITSVVALTLSGICLLLFLPV